MRRLSSDKKSALFAMVILFLSVLGASAKAEVSQTPLLLGGGSVPGSLALVPSVEYPTVLSVANIDENYRANNTYVGYFDSDKCYKYNQSDEYFEPSSWRSGSCTGNREWDGNFLNWALTPTIDPFRSALTGGYRVVDTADKTVLQKAKNTGQQGSEGDRSLSQYTNLAPISGWNTLHILVSGKQHDFQVTNNKGNSKTIVLDRFLNDEDAWSNNRLRSGNTYTLKARVRVCVPGFLESNCKPYPSGHYKPEGLIQQYANDLRYSAFGYLNETGNQRDGGVLRAEQKFVGPTRSVFGGIGEESNPQKEWDENTGVLLTDPDVSVLGSSKSSWSHPGNSGVINYINKFGELNNNDLKGNDPVSELYYTALRYFKNQGNVPSYTSGGSASQRTIWADGFPVIENNWSDPINYSCQKNVILGIGDANTHQDHDLPHTDDPLNVNAYTQKIFDLESINKSPTADFSGRGNSAYIAGLAYYANTTNIRPGEDLGDQRISTYWVDVRENKVLEGRKTNQYWLATKYGGFDVPKDFNPLSADTLPNELWTDGDTTEKNDLRPRNFYVASDATKMVQSLKEAFAKIAQELRSTTTSLAANTTRLDTDTVVYQSIVDTSTWSGDLLAKAVDSSTSSVDEEPMWYASVELDQMDPDERKIYTGQGVPFTWNSLDSNQRAALRGLDGTDSESLAKDRVKYLRGDRENERSAANPEGAFRQRGSVLGDIANSDPQYMHHQNFGYSQLPVDRFSGGEGADYSQFRNKTAYKSRPPVVVVGANDGMLHVFNANNGKNLFSYVPENVFPKLYRLTQHEYEHQYFVDGTPRIADAHVGGEWKTLAVGATGAGGNSVFALDITDPDLMDGSSVLWEFTDDDLGMTIGQPGLVPLNNGKFGVIVSSGYERGDTDEAYVWVLNASDGQVIKKFPIATSGDLGGVLSVDLNNNKIADRLYVADTTGKVWRLDVDSANSGEWGAPTALGNAPLFHAKDKNGVDQPITAPLDAAYTADKQLLIVFGTGSYYKVNDGVVGDNPRVESFYGIHDQGQQVQRSNLLQQTILKEAVQDGFNVRAVSDKPLAANHKGWYLDLEWASEQGGQGPKGERIVSRATLGGNRVTFTTLIPTVDPCAAGGESWVMSLDLATGSRLAYPFFDLNQDGEFDEDDYITIFVEGEGEIKVPVSGFADSEGAIKSPLILDSKSSGKRYLCYASSEGVEGEAGVQPVCIEIRGGDISSNRLSWHEEL